jgi:hypothetical protein
MEEIKAPRLNVGFIYRSFTVKYAHKVSKRHQSFKSGELADQSFYHLIDLASE